MKIKEKVEVEGMNKELYDLIIDFLQFEINKLSLLDSAKFYFYQNGLEHYRCFINYVTRCCKETKYAIVEYLVNHMEDVPDMKLPGLDLDFDDKYEPFVKLASMEDNALKKLSDIVEKACEVKDYCTGLFFADFIKHVDHIACRALEAVRNDENPLDLIPCK